MQTPVMKGKVYLMGAAPADLDLLNAKAVRLLRTAEVVFHDDQVSPKVLELLPASAQVRNVHKLGTQAGALEQQVQSLLISAARQGHEVLRLKATDPLPSAQAHEEAAALAQAGIDFEVIPVATSAMGAAAGARSN